MSEPRLSDVLMAQHDAENANLQSDFVVVAGTYERLLYGLACTPAPHSLLVPMFIYPAHINCIKAVAANQRFLATGSTDEHVKIYDLRARKEVGTLMHHAGTITALAFFSTTHLLTAAEDGAVGIVRTSDWEPLKLLKGHTAAVTSMALHPSGKLALSVARDRQLKCWDLTRGLCAYTLRMPAVAERIAWSPSGSHYALMFEKSVVIHDVATGDKVATIESPRSRLNAMAPAPRPQSAADADADSGLLVIGGEDKSVTIADFTGAVLMRWASPHQARVKDLAALACPKRATTVLASCSTDGGIFAWDLRACLAGAVADCAASAVSAAKDGTRTTDLAKILRSDCPPHIAAYDAKCRLTCIALSLVNTKAAATSNESKAAALEAPESDYEDVGISKPKVTVSIEGEISTAASTAADRKRARDALPTPIARNKNKVKKLVKKLPAGDRAAKKHHGGGSSGSSNGNAGDDKTKAVEAAVNLVAPKQVKSILKKTKPEAAPDAQAAAQASASAAKSKKVKKHSK
ncbi:Protein mak11 [Polyrhizophydium stewartii]|uniref:Protein mak11 n=1 Tax=Polyrhizophydium stewartii TaxID=2732419 RepID=A0ABR4N353_9FUNG|nr:hypothetical protein HK105_004799 [Polyrhizophydium stewartii]